MRVVFNPERGAFPMLSAIALAACLLLLGAAPPAGACVNCSAYGAPPPASVSFQSSSPPTVAECWAAWHDSSATLTCGGEEMSVSGNYCSVGAWCETGTTYLVTRFTEIEASVDDIADLNNCDATLRVGSC